MQSKNKWKWLQLFADGGDGGSAGGDGGAAASATGDTGADAGHQRLLELGVPADKIRKNRSYSVPKAAQAPATAGQSEVEQQQEQQQDDAAEVSTEEEKQDTPKRLTWDEIKADPEYSKEMQKMVQQRLRKSKAAEESMEKLTPALELLHKIYGLDPENPDYAALAEKVLHDNKIYEERGLELGVAPEIARKMDQFDLMQARQKRQEQVTMQDQAMQRHYGNLVQQGEALKQKYPDFDLQKELRNPTFARMTAPNVGLSVEDAYYAVHRKEIEQAALQVTAQQTAQQISNAIRSATMRPAENGTSAAAPSVTSFDYKNASKAEREALKKRIREAGARGEKIYPGR